MHLVPLWRISIFDFFGIIILKSTGIFWENQTGGTLCSHPKAEGIFIPLPGHWKPDPDPLLDYSGEYNPEEVKKFLSSSESLSSVFSPINNNYRLVSNIMEESLRLEEAWVPVTINNCFLFESGVLGPFVGNVGILTYANSD